ncbi:MAG: transporter permease [Hyphomicrobiales bacterium]|nr:transporter permease [Hyphomicrobiales bacterium]
MTRRSLISIALVALALIATAFLMRLSPMAEGLSRQTDPALLCLTAMALLLTAPWRPRFAAVPTFAASALLTGAALLLLRDADISGAAGAGFWALVGAALVCAGATMTALSDLALTDPRARKLRDIAIPAVFGLMLVMLAELVIRGAGVPSVLLPAPSSVAWRFVHALPMLFEDLVQTFVKGVVIGFVIGNAAGFGAALLVQDRPFFRRGLLPMAGFISSLPIVGIAPIMVMWFGFDWPSKAAVVAIITFFPMFTNAVAGLSGASRIDMDLMHSYAASPSQRLAKLHIPAALPFVFNALKINSTLAFIGAIVAEFFGTPVVGMGFRISIEAARMSMDVVWAEILLAALVGTASYGCLVLLERKLTFWHASQRV